MTEIEKMKADPELEKACLEFRKYQVLYSSVFTVGTRLKVTPEELDFIESEQDKNLRKLVDLMSLYKCEDLDETVQELTEYFIQKRFTKS